MEEEVPDHSYSPEELGEQEDDSPERYAQRSGRYYSLRCFEISNLMMINRYSFAIRRSKFRQRLSRLCSYFLDPPSTRPSEGGRRPTTIFDDPNLTPSKNLPLT
jgi:hypothetical protein